MPMTPNSVLAMSQSFLVTVTELILYFTLAIQGQGNQHSRNQDSTYADAIEVRCGGPQRAGDQSGCRGPSKPPWQPEEKEV